MMRRRCSYAAIAFAVAFAGAATARADVKLPAIFGDNMVLQADKPIPVWGTAEPGEKIEVRASVDKAAQPDASKKPAGDAVMRSKETTADDKGNWKVVLDPLPPSEEPIGFVVTAKNKVSLENVLVGEVWLASGQSNMEMSLNSVKDAQKEVAEAKYPTMRLFLVNKAVSPDAPADDVKGQWVVCSPETVGSFSAVAYFFGRDILSATDRPVGLIGTYWGGTPAESWASREKLESNEALKPLVANWDAQSKKEGDAGEKARTNPHHPATLYNAMIEPLIPFAIRGAIWYQGESNAGRAYQYRTLFPAMITDWRERWGEGDFPFLFVQLANFMQRKDQPGDSAWAELREAQSMTLDLPNTGQAVIIDIGEAGDIHPKNKQDVGKRLALAALKIAYGKKDVVFSGPTLKESKFENGEAVLIFDNVGKGLQVDGAQLKGFALAGPDRVFHWAEATIEEGEPDVVVVSSPDVPNPVAVRYAWADNPEATLYNEEGLPASPFRTDDWPGVTEGKQ
jgi:sialate O-acetylesterase